MRVKGFLLFVFVVCLMACVDKTKYSATGSVSGLEQFYGKYIGFSPTDESAIGMGEMSIDVQSDKIKLSMATGINIQDEEIELSKLVSMTADEIKKEFKDGSSYPERIVGLRGQDGHPKFLFLRDPSENEFGLVLRLGEMSEILGPTVLYSPSQVARGDYDKALKNIDRTAGKGVLPRLRNNGKAEK